MNEAEDFSEAKSARMARKVEIDRLCDCNPMIYLGAQLHTPDCAARHLLGKEMQMSDFMKLARLDRLA